MDRTLPNDSEERKRVPLFSGLLTYFPAALAGVARWSKIGNDKHNPGQPLHHARGKSSDHADCILRHLTDIADLEARITRDGHSDAIALQVLDELDALTWRALALSQETRERLCGAPLAPAARLPETQAPVKSPYVAPPICNGLREQNTTQPHYCTKDAGCGHFGCPSVRRREVSQ
jgi:hypothetical protein